MPQDDDLAVACFELARATKWARKPIDAAEITTLARGYAKIARTHLSEESDIDVPLLANAVRYIGQAHGMPSGDDTRWFEYMLVALVEVARPNSGLDAGARAFLFDLMDGIQNSLKEE